MCCSSVKALTGGIMKSEMKSEGDLISCVSLYALRDTSLLRVCVWVKIENVQFWNGPPDAFQR
jgi:hypothetical protein